MCNENHSVEIDVEKARIGCSYCDEWDPFILSGGDDTVIEHFCKTWLELHLEAVKNKEVNNMRTKAKAVQRAHFYGIASTIKELINQLQKPGHPIAPTVISCVDILELCDELDKL